MDECLTLAYQEACVFKTRGVLWLLHIIPRVDHNSLYSSSFCILGLQGVIYLSRYESLAMLQYDTGHHEGLCNVNLCIVTPSQSLFVHVMAKKRTQVPEVIGHSKNMCVRQGCCSPCSCYCRWRTKVMSTARSSRKLSESFAESHHTT